MNRTAATKPPAASLRLTALGRAAAASGVLGVGAGILTLAYPAAVSHNQWSYPFPEGVQWGSSVVLAAAHALTAAGFVGVVLAAPHRHSRPATIALWVAIVGFVGLSLSELASGAIGSQTTTSDAAARVGAAFGVASLATALGSIIAGLIIVRTHTWHGLARWVVLASGALMLVVVTPALISGALWPRTLALMLWSITFVPLGQAVSRADPGQVNAS